MIYDDDADLSLLDGKTVAIIGYGSQGHAHALNLKDRASKSSSGCARTPRRPRRHAPKGLEVLSVVDAASRGDLVMILVPDELHREVWEGDPRRHRHPATCCSSGTASPSTTARSTLRPAWT